MAFNYSQNNPLELVPILGADVKLGFTDTLGFSVVIILLIFVVLFVGSVYLIRYLYQKFKNNTSIREGLVSIKSEAIGKLKSHSPKEVYILVAMLYFFLFLNASELSYIFDLRDSVVYGLIRGIGDFRYDATLILYWVLAVIFVSISLIKAKKISAWLWDND